MNKCREAFEKIYKETDGNYLHVLDRYDANMDSYPNNDYVQMRYKWFCVGCESRQAEIDKLQARVDAANAVIHEYYTGSYQESPDLVVDLEQALKGGEK